jgi:RimJ/RimL family protein N-acetyltransferase
MLQGEKVTLRALKRDDLHRLWAFQNDVEFEILTGGPPWEPQSLERLERNFEESLVKDERNGPNFAIEADGQFIGTCGLFRYDQTTQICELGIGIGDRRYWGHGYGRDAIRTLLVYGFQIRNLHKIWLIVNDDNPRAIHSYLACGFMEEGRLRKHVWSNGRYLDLVQMGILRSEWEAHQQQAQPPLASS